MIWTHKYISQSRNRFPSSLIVVSPFAILTLFFSYSCCCSHADTHLLSRSMTFFFRHECERQFLLFFHMCVSFVIPLFAPFPFHTILHITLPSNFISFGNGNINIKCIVCTPYTYAFARSHTQTHTCGMKQVIDFTQLRNKLTYIKLKIYHT